MVEEWKKRRVVVEEEVEVVEVVEVDDGSREKSSAFRLNNFAAAVLIDKVDVQQA